MPLPIADPGPATARSNPEAWTDPADLSGASTRSRAKLTVAPPPKDRFAFYPPPGWKGAITRDWQERRLQEMTA